MRQPVGARIELGVAQRGLAQAQGRGIGAARHLLLEAAVHDVAAVQDLVIAAPGRQLLAFVGTQQRHLVHGTLGLPGEGLQHGRIVGGQALHAARLEQLAGIDQADAQAAIGALAHFHGQLELRICGRQRLAGHRPARHLLQRLPVLHQMIEQHLEQGAVRQAALRLQRLHQLLERQRVVGLRALRRLAGLLQHVGQAHAPVDAVAQHQGVDEKADHALQVGMRAVGHGHADADVLLARVAVQQRLPSCQQQREERVPLLAGLRAQRLQGRAGQLEAVPPRTIACQRLARMVGGQGQHRLGLAWGHLQPFQPVGQRGLLALLGLLSLLPLPDGVVHVLQRRAAVRGAGIQRRQIVQQDLHGGAVGDDVVHHQRQDVLMGLQPHQGSPGQRPLLQIKGWRTAPAAIGRRAPALRGLALRGIQPLQLQPALGSRRCSTPHRAGR
jgi:hypothetical protein